MFFFCLLAFSGFLENALRKQSLVLISAPYDSNTPIEWDLTELAGTSLLEKSSNVPTKCCPQTLVTIGLIMIALASCYDHSPSGQNSCRTKASRIFRSSVPNFAPNFALNFPRIFWGVLVLRLVGNGDQKKKKITKNPRHLSMQNSQANSKNKSTKVFWRAGKATLSTTRSVQN